MTVLKRLGLMLADVVAAHTRNMSAVGQWVSTHLVGLPYWSISYIGDVFSYGTTQGRLFIAHSDFRVIVNMNCERCG